MKVTCRITIANDNGEAVSDVVKRGELGETDDTPEEVLGVAEVVAYVLAGSNPSTIGSTVALIVTILERQISHGHDAVFSDFGKHLKKMVKEAEAFDEARRASVLRARAEYPTSLAER